MTKKFRKFTKRLVIDASVVHAAGDQAPDHPTSKACRDFLLSVLEICHRTVLTSEIAQEWKRHASLFSNEWHVAMVSRRKAVHVPSGSTIDIDQAVSAASLSPNARRDMHKDLHLIEAALATDRRIASLDDAARRMFGDLSATVRELRKVVWVNPSAAGETPLPWLASGAKLEARRMLGRRSTG